MKFLVDAHLPRRLAGFLQTKGHDAIHTRDLPLENRTPDSVINQVSMTEQRIVITKDSDFMDSHVLKGEPYKLLLISTGNIKNNDLLRLFEQNLDRILEVFATHTYVELDRHHLTVHM